MIIRKFEKEDAVGIYKIIKECFESLEIGGHTKKGIALQIKYNSPKNLIKNSKKINYFVAEINEKLVGIGGYDQTKIRTFFVDPHYHKKGIGKKLLSKILEEAKNKGVKKLLVWSTFYAQPFYAKFGFAAHKEIKPPEGKDNIILIEMEKKLNLLN